MEKIRHEKIIDLVNIFKSYIYTLIKKDYWDSYFMEVCYFKQIIKGLLIDDALNDLMEKRGRPIYFILEKENLKSTSNMFCDMEYIEKVYEKLFNREHELRNNLFYMESIPEVRAILEVIDIMPEHRKKVNNAIRNIEREFRRIDKEKIEIDRNK